MPSVTLPVRVLLFARYAELLGTGAIALDLPAGATVGDALDRVRALPGGHLVPPRPFVARGTEQVSAEVRLNHGDELALLPPMSGG